MIYGLYLSAAGIMTNSYRQDVIANNIANSETVGFKRDLAVIRQRPTAARERAEMGNHVDPGLEPIGGGMLSMPTRVDTSQGELEPTGNDLDVAIQGSGFFAVREGNQPIRLTRNGQFILNRAGQLALGNNAGQAVLDVKQQPIQLNSAAQATISVDGVVSQQGRIVAKIGTFDVSDPSQLRKEGGTLLSTPDGVGLAAANPTLRSQFIERSNVEPSNELAGLMDVQRQLEANANMIRYQDETLDKLVNDAGKIS